jgi:autotransporter translocation and assembly factor TamB
MASDASRGRRLLRALVALPLLVAALLAGIGWAVLHGFERERVRALVESQLASTLGIPVAIGALEGRLDRAPVFRDVRLGPEETPLLRATRVAVEFTRISLSPPSLDLALVRVEGVHARWPELAVLWEPREDAAAGEADDARDAGLPLRIAIQRGELEIEELDVVIEDGSSKATGALAFRGWVWPEGHRVSLPLPEAADARLSITHQGPGLEGPVSGELAADFADGLLTLRPSRLVAAPGSVELAGRTRVRPWLAGEVDTEAELHARVDGLDLAQLLADPAYATNLAGEVEVRPDGPDGIALRVDLAGEVARAGVVDGVFAEGRLSTDGWVLETARIRSPQMSLDASASGGGTRLDEADVQLHGEAALLDPWLPEALPLAGRLRAKLQARRRDGALHSRVELASDALDVGELGRISLDFLVSARDLDELRVARARLVRDGLTLDVSPGATVARSGSGVRLSGVALQAADGSLTLEGGVGPEAFHDVTVEARDIDLIRLGLLPADAGVAGKLEGALRLDGPFRRPDVRGELEWVEGGIQGEPIEEVRLSVAPEGDRLRGTGVARMGAETAELTLLLPRDMQRWGERLPYDPLLEAHLRVEQFDFSVLTPFLPEVPSFRDARGYATGSIGLRGSAAGLDVDADLALVEVSLYGVPMRRRLGPARGRILIREGLVQIEDGVLQGDEGELHIHGRLPLEPARADTPGSGRVVRMEAQGFALRFPPLVPESFVDGTLELSGSVEVPTIRGDLAVSGLRVRIPRSADRIGSEFRVAQGTSTRFEETPDSGPELAEADIDVRIHLADPARVDGQGLALLLDGELRYRAEPGRLPAWFGTGRVVRGSASALGKTFVVERGEAVLAGEAEPDPLLDVRARYPVADVVLIGRIEGRSSSPTIRLESEPPLSEDDRLSYLLFGRPADAFDGSGDASLSAVAAQLAGGVALGELNQRFGGRVAIDQFSVGTSDEGRTEVGLGATFGERTSVRGVTELEDEAERRIEVEYRFAPGWSVQGTTSNDGHAGIDLIWTKNY